MSPGLHFENVGYDQPLSIDRHLSGEDMGKVAAFILIKSNAKRWYGGMTHEIGVSGYVEKGLLHKSLESVFAGSSLQIAGAFAGEGIDKHADYAAQLEESLEAEKFLASMVTIFVTTRGFVYGPQSYCLPHVLNTRGWSTVVCWFWEFWTNRSFVVCMSIFSRLGNSERLCIELLKIYAVILENWLWIGCCTREPLQ